MGIGQHASNAGFQGEYQEGYWLFHQVTRNPQERTAFPHELSAYQNIRISVSPRTLTAAILGTMTLCHLRISSSKIYHFPIYYKHTNESV